jgi:DNA-binding transcriptional regulator LsrR (DeoR family)
LLADRRQVNGIKKSALEDLGRPRFNTLQRDFWVVKLMFCQPEKRKDLQGMAAKELTKKDYDIVLDELERREKEWDTGHSVKDKPVLSRAAPDFVKLIFPMASGPRGGDVLIAREVLNHHCHAVVFFQDPGTAQPHDPDIRLFERTCQFWPVERREGTPRPDRRVLQTYATCVSDFESAVKWAEHMNKVISSPVRKPPLAHSLRQKCGLKDVVIIESESDEDSPTLGEALARAGAGYLHRRILTTAREGKQTRIGIGYGWTPLELLKQLEQMRAGGLLDNKKPDGDIIWSTLVANLSYEFSQHEASVIVDRFQKFYAAGIIETFRASGVIATDSARAALPVEDQELIKKLDRADLIVTSAAQWKPSAPPARILNPEAMGIPPNVGTISFTFLTADGHEARPKLSHIGLDYEGFQRAAKRGAVIVICGGKSRRKAALAALRGGLVSVLVTTRGTAKFILDKWDQ